MCYVVVPITPVASPANAASAPAIAAAREATASSWIPRASDAREVVKALEGQARRNAPGRVLSVRHIAPPLTDARRTHRTVPLLISPVQRWLLCAAPHHAADDYPD